MSLGEKAKLTLSSDYAYGPRGVPGMYDYVLSIIF